MIFIYTHNSSYSNILVQHGIIYLTIIPRAHVGYEVIDSQRGA